MNQVADLICRGITNENLILYLNQVSSSVHVIMLDHNELDYVPWVLFARFRNLQKITFQNNNIKHVYGGMGVRLCKLECVDLSCNEISNINEGCFMNCVNLKRLNLKFNQLSISDPGVIRVMNEIRGRLGESEEKIRID